MNNKILIVGIIMLIFLAGCTKAPIITAPIVSSENVESSSSSAEEISESFIDDATPTADQVVPDLT